MLTTLLLCACALAQNPHVESPSVALQHAFEVAKVENRRVLLIQESADAALNKEVEDLLRARRIGRELLYEYAQLSVAAAADDARTAAPLLQIFPAVGDLLGTLSAEELRNGSGELDADVLLAFLKEHEAEPWDALEVLEAARLEAVKSNKNLFVHLGAPW